MRKLFTVIMLSLSLILMGCQPVEKTARDSVATAKGYLDSAKAHHPECAQGAISSQCTLIQRGVAAKDAVIDALVIYCASPAFNENAGPCVPNKDAAPKLQAALSNLDSIMTNLKALAGGQ